MAEAHSSQFAEEAPVREALRQADDVLLPDMNVQEAVAAFDVAEAEVLAVIDSLASRRVLGILSETYALRRYSSELDRRRREFMGEV